MHELMKRVTERLKNPPLSAEDLKKEIIIFPSIGWAKPTFEELEDSKFKVSAISDMVAPGQFMDFLSPDYFIRRKIIPIDDVLENHKDKVLLVAIWDRDNRLENIEIFRGQGFPIVTDINGYTFSEACAGNIHHQKELYYLEKAWDYFTDESEREIILNKALIYLGVIDVMPFELPQYFIDFMDITEDEIFADCGFFNGDTAESFIKETNNKFKKYYAFEPNAKNIEAAKPEIKSDPHIVITQAGVYSHCTTLMFNDEHADASSFTLMGEGHTEVPVISLDAFFADKEKPTFIKMDIEGSEIQAILGAKTLIQTYKPKLAICLYHKPEDMIEIPRLIKEILPEYKFLLKQHRDIGSETVLYCKI
ncbi:MAG: FkbM family methyltransferase [Ruminococcus sp.]|jgi:FkbM family methyltransferase|nr:FkbM family methyltransferase [Ruminococcus sp.]